VTTQGASVFFTKVGLVVAWLGIVLSVMQFALAWIVFFNLDTPGFDAARYIGSSNPGRMVNQSLLVFAIALALGIVAEISRSIREKGGPVP
jgi:hypothetical protein